MSIVFPWTSFPDIRRFAFSAIALCLNVMSAESPSITTPSCTFKFSTNRKHHHHRKNTHATTGQGATWNGAHGHETYLCNSFPEVLERGLHCRQLGVFISWWRAELRHEPHPLERARAQVQRQLTLRKQKKNEKKKTKIKNKRENTSKGMPQRKTAGETTAHTNNAAKRHKMTVIDEKAHAPALLLDPIFVQRGRQCGFSHPAAA